MKKNRMKSWKKLVAAILAVVMLATSADLQLLAAPVEEVVTGEAVVVSDDAGAGEEPVTAESLDENGDLQEEEPEETAPDSLVLSEDNPQILSEVEEKREESSKTFLMSDGTFMVAQYGAPIHYEDENEEWQEIDNVVRQINLCLIRHIKTGCFFY